MKIEHTAKCVAVAQVKHSQALSVKVWVALKLVRWRNNECALHMYGWDRRGLFTYCSCSFLLEGNTQAKQNLSYASLPCSWLPPSFHTGILPVSKINFRTPQLKRKLLLNNPHSSPMTSATAGKARRVLKPS